MSAIPPNLSIGSIAGAGAGALGSLVGGVGNLVASGDQAAGYNEEASYYGEAAGIAGENAAITANSTQLESYMSNRSLATTEATGRAVASANGLQLNGSEEWLMRENETQGALANQQITAQGAINQNGYLTQQQALLGEQAQASAAASAASSSGAMGIIGGVIGAAAKILPLFA